MLGFTKTVLVLFALSGIAMSGAVASDPDQLPLDRAIEVHEDHLAYDSPMPDQSTQGQQTALDNLRFNQERFVTKHSDRLSEDDDKGPKAR